MDEEKIIFDFQPPNLILKWDTENIRYFFSILKVGRREKRTHIEELGMRWLVEKWPFKYVMTFATVSFTPSNDIFTVRDCFSIKS